MKIYRDCLRLKEDYLGQASRSGLLCRQELGCLLLSAGDFDEAYTAAYVGFDLAVQDLGISDGLSFSFSKLMVLASLAQDDMAGFAAKGESIQEIPGMMNKWVDFFEEEIWDSLETVFARDKSLQQAENHLRKAFKACCAEFSLERESTLLLERAYNHIGAVVRKHKKAQRS